MLTKQYTDLKGEVFTNIAHVDTVAAIDSSITIKQIKRNMARPYKCLQNIAGIREVKNEPIALVGGGPSLESQLDKLRKFKNIMVCGSAHDYLIGKDITPTYATVCDPDAVAANYMKSPIKYIKYLISTNCDDTVYDTLDGYEIYMWHCYSDDHLKEFSGANYQAVGGGCTVGLRSLSIAIILGYSDIHFFGFDSCLGIGGKHHAYGFSDTEKEELGQVYQIRIGMNDKINKEKLFYCAGYQLAQLTHFKDFYVKYNSLFEPTFHGEGLLTESMKIINAERDRLYRQDGTTLADQIQKNRAARLEKLKGALEAAKGQTI